MTDIEDQAFKTARSLADELVDEGAEAVILTGSWARGDAHPESDLDIRVVGDGEPKKLLRRGDFLVSVGWSTEKENVEMFSDPSEVGSIVPGWRSAELLADPSGKGAKLKERAEDWNWSEIEDETDKHVAAEITKLAEEVHTLFTNLELEIVSAAAATRSLIVSELVPIMSTHLRLLYESEKELWDSVSEKMGGRWREMQERAQGQNGDSFRACCRAAFELFLMAQEKTQGLLNDEQSKVVEHATKLATKGSKESD